MTEPRGPLLAGLAELAVVVGANVQRDQAVMISADVAHIELVRAVAEAAYRHGAQFVDVELRDLLLERPRILHAPGDLRRARPEWSETRIRELAEIGGARIMILGPTAPDLFDDLDPERVDRAAQPRSVAWREVEYDVNNTIVPGPNPAWAGALHPDLSAPAAESRLWQQIATACRLDRPDPVGSWRHRFAELRAVADALTALRLDAIRLSGPGTDLRVGLIPGARWEPPTNINTGGIEHSWNLPSEEVYTSPDRNRVEGQVTLTRPAVIGERLVHDVVLSFRDGQVASVYGGDGLEALSHFIARDPGTSRLGELALVDADSAVGSVGQTFGMIMLDENAASHIALGFGFPVLADPEHGRRINQSGDHLDVTIGSRELDVTGIDQAGREYPLLREGRWQPAVLDKRR
jgi:aminopeptidase